MKKLSRKILCLALTALMLLGMLPVGAFAGGEPVTVSVSYQNSDAGFVTARQSVALTPGLAASYGYSYASTVGEDDVTALDALVAVHRQIFGEDVADNLTVNAASGSVTKVMGGADSASGLVFYVNGGVPGDGAGVFYTITETVLHDGDVIEFFIYQDTSYWGDYYAWFEQGGNKVEAVSATAGVPLELTINGYMAMWAMFGYDLDDYTYPIEDAAIVTVDEDGLFGEPLAVSDEDGKATLTFPAAGTYILSAYDVSGYDTPLMSPWLVVTVTEAPPAPTHLFTVDASGTLTKVTNLDGSKATGVVIVPAVVDGITVKTIPLNTAVFQSNTGVTKVTLPNTVTTIAQGASTTGAFRGCTNLEEIVFADGGADKLTIGDQAFRDDKALKSVTLPTTRATQIGTNTAGSNGNVFNNCTTLTDINLGDSKVTSIGAVSFSGCTALKSVTFPATLTILVGGTASGTFRNCTSLETITFKNGGTAPLNIGSYAFQVLTETTNLKTIVFPTDRPITIGTRAFGGNTKLSSVNLGDCVIASIGSIAFVNSALTSVTIRSRDAVIDPNAFESTVPLTLYGWYGSDAQACSASANVTFIALDDTGISSEGDFIVTDGGELIDYIGSATEVHIPAAVNGVTVTKLNQYALHAHKDITYLDIQAQITEIGASAFSGFNALESITMPETIAKLGASAFEGCSALTKITFGESSSLVEIGDRAFYGDSALLYIDLPQTLKTLGVRAFFGTGFQYIELPDSLTSIGNYAFASSKLIEFELSPALAANATLGTHLFNGSAQLAKVTLPEGLTAISTGWFSGCTSLKAIDIPSTVTSIGANALQNSGLTSLVVPAGVTVIPNVLAAGSTRLETVTLLGDVTSIGETTFSNCAALREINIPATVKSVSGWAFTNCTSLKEVILPQGLETLGSSVFSGASGLEALVIPASVTTIGTNLVQNCDAAKLNIYVERGSFADGNVNIKPGTFRYPDIEVKAEVRGAAAPYSDAALAVLRGAAAIPGLPNAVPGYRVGVLDALVAVSGAIGGDIVVENGKITEIFGVEAGNAGFTLNGSPLAISYAATTAIEEGDTLLFFTGKTDGGEDQGIAWFEFGGAESNALVLAPGRSYTLKLTSASGPVANMPVYALGVSGEPVGAPIGTTGSDGNVTITFADSGNYTIAGVDANNRYFFSRLEATVYSPDLTLQSLVFAGTPAFDVSSALSNGFTAGQFVEEATLGNVTSYNVYVNADTTGLRFSSAGLRDLENAQLKTLSVYLGGSDAPMAGAADLKPGANGAYAIPAFSFAGDSLSVSVVLRFSENGQDFVQTYDITVIRDAGAMAQYAGFLDIRGANRTSLSKTYSRDITSAAIYYDKGMTTAYLDIKVERDVEVYLDGTALTGGSAPVAENGRQVVTYRAVLADFTRSYVITTKLGGVEGGTFTVTSFTAKSPYDGVYTPDSIAGYMQAPGQFSASTPWATLISNTAWSKFFSLGGFGGYVDYYYEEAITNDPNNPYGVDFIIYGNAFSSGGAGEAAGVQVSSDGVTWYDLAGQRHYELSSHYDTATLLDGSTIESFLIARAGENGHKSGYPTKTQFGYADIAACSENANGEGTYYVNARAGNPYRDTTVRENLVVGDGFDLAWAVDKAGKPVDLPDGIHYIRAQNVIDVGNNGSLGEVSPEIGTVTRVNPDTRLSPVGVTEAPSALTVNGQDILPLAPVYSVSGGAVKYYELDLNKSGTVVDVRVTGGADDNIFVNMERYTGAAEYSGLLDASGSRTVRVIVQSGNRQPVIYVISCANGDNSEKNADLGSIILAPGDTALTKSGNSYTATVANNVEKVTLNVSALNPAAAIALDGAAITHNEATPPLPLAVGANSFSVTITSTDGSVTATYPVVITRSAANQPPTGGGQQPKTITVTFTFTGDDLHYVNAGNLGTHRAHDWISATSVTVPEGSTVKYVTDLLLYNAGVEFHTAGGTYIDKVRNPLTGEWLAEMDNGPNSGWMYKHNNTIASRGYAERVLRDGDTVVWFYTDDYVKETGYENAFWDSNPAGGSDDDTEIGDEKAPLADGKFVTFDDVRDIDWFYAAIVYAVENGLMNGVGDNKFAPNAKLTRAMLITVLARYAGVDTTGGATWYEKALEWGVAQGITDGTNPDGYITRRQLVTMLYRFAKIGEDGWGGEAMAWAKSEKILNDGRGEDTATRAEVATILQRFIEGLDK
ncbi:MAG: leucine-rich repeat protein [Oscillospiraceae bacterium]|jgi:hypothetical protein|nr:leucine-rich repeat protein [Oscillospiraceae bacterium]